ncbi:N-acetylmuramoyl-L-alanine amidase [Rhodococcus sp. 06-470-2]|uniref:N-acetylmuramoyl-L-alanine amidase n=1 Tax=unclassified Rhodococcus (in: high G+C Gram-positive bacteria) TaxID=192944 RepID=UPI000B9BA9D4|nr:MULTISPECIES: N-acetylmuramoyl-L-alanine amidase [unclassified Rhodococcus (in: high G+C Gram-positive bacteria)]OZC69023.1 N-acetylmuramoyl-L-alanine amidase [Rhodococcus sp. 06-470-2]OZE65051.1 N-acetylmuramoyl-L-alanine amidase [Rhodococcus sp. 05-2221-1B]
MTRSALTALMCAGILGAGVLASVPASATPADTAPAASTELSGKTVFLDPGHQGTAHSENLQRQVNDGRGGTKDCQTTGMTTLEGVPEHTINWKVSELVRSSLESLGATVKTSRADDTGWGGCVDDRARAASESGADVAVSIHADSTSTTTDADKHGFHLIVPTLPIPNAAADAAQSEGGRSASTLMRDSYVRAGFEPANYAGVENGIQERSDVAGPALTTVPLVFVEMGNGSNPDDAALLESSDGQLKHAIAISTGIIDYLLGAETPSPSASAATTPASAATTPAATATTTPATPDPTATTGTAATAPGGVGPTAEGRSALSRLLESVSPYVDSFGVDGLEGLATPGNVSAVSTFAQGLLKQILADR